MAKKKIKTAFFCQNCGHESPKWMGSCPSCGEWNTFVEEVLDDGKASQEVAWTASPKAGGRRPEAKPRPISDIEYKATRRLDAHDGELNRVMGGGIVPGSLTLIGGEPGIGKSTLMLQVALRMLSLKILYVSGEESQEQIRMRAERIGPLSENCYILTETQTQKIFQHVEKLQPDVLVLDSIQTLYTQTIEASPGSISQVRACTGELMRFAKLSGVPVFLIGHITKDGSIAGPKVLEHMVDTVLQFEGDRHMSYRLLRTVKNRFGSTSELGIYEMRNAGLREVSNPSEVLISQREEGLSGTAIGATLEGNRPLLIEVQSLVSDAAYGTPQRTSTGFDNKRLNMLLAVLEKRGGFRFSDMDVFLNIAGGLKVEDPALDLAVSMAMLSSFADRELDRRFCFAAEVGLGGEIRAVQRIESRISEAAKLGFKEMYISRHNLRGADLKQFKEIQVRAFGKLEEVITHLF